MKRLVLNSMFPLALFFSKPDDPFGDGEEWFGGGSEMPDAGEMPSEQTGNEAGLPFLKPHDVKNKPQGTLELIRVGVPTEYSDIVLVVQLGGKQFRLGMKPFDPGYVACKARFGSKKADWHGTLLYKVMPWKGGSGGGFVAVRPTPVKK